jgi:phospholipase D1/2
MSGNVPRYVQMQLEPSASVSSSLFLTRQDPADLARIFDELPEATIVSVSRPDASDISPMLLSYTIEFQYKQVRAISLSYPKCFKPLKLSKLRWILKFPS